MNQIAIDFDAYSHARRSDPETSHIAARRTREFAGGHIATILAALEDAGEAGLTIDEIAKRCALTSTQCARRLPDMQKLRLAIPTGFTRLSASGRPERVWRSL